MASSP